MIKTKVFRTANITHFAQPHRSFTLFNCGILPLYPFRLAVLLQASWALKLFIGFPDRRLVSQKAREIISLISLISPISPISPISLISPISPISPIKRKSRPRWYLAGAAVMSATRRCVDQSWLSSSALADRLERRSFLLVSLLLVSFSSLRSISLRSLSMTLYSR